MTPRRKRLLAVAAILAGVGLATAVALKAFDNNLLYFYDPSQVAGGKAPTGKTFRIGSAYDPTYGGGKADLGWEPTKIAGMKSDDGHVWIGGFTARMNPDGSGVHIIGHNYRNSYEQTVTAYGDVFQTDNDDPPACRTTFLLEFGNAGFCSFDGKRSWGADRRPGQSIPVAEWRQEDPGTMPSGDVYGGGSPTGITFVEESALGDKYRGLLLSCEPGRNVVFGYYPKEAGAGFDLKRFDFVTSNREGEFAGTDFKGGRNEARTLKTMSNYGFVEMKREKNQVRPVAMATEFRILA